MTRRRTGLKIVWGIMLLLSTAASAFSPPTSGPRVEYPPQRVRPEMVLQHGHNGLIKSIVFSSDGRTIFSGGYDGTVIVWDFSTGEIRARLENHRSSISMLRLSADGTRLVAVGSAGVGCGTGDGTIETFSIWDTRTFQYKGSFEYTHFPGNGDYVFSPDLTRIMTYDDAPYVWELQADGFHKSEGRLPKPSAWLVTGEVISLNDSSTIQWLDDRTWKVKLTRQQEGFVEQVDERVFSPKGDTMAVTLSRNRSIQIWKPRNGRYIRTLAGSENSVGIEFLNDGLIIKAATDDGKLKLWDAVNGKMIRFLDLSMKFDTMSPDFKIGAVADTETAVITLHEAASGKVIRKLKGLGAPVMRNEEGHGGLFDLWGSVLTTDCIINSVRLSPDGRLLAYGCGRTVRLWNMERPELAGVLTGHPSDVTALDFAPNGKTLASSARVGPVRLWDVSTAALKGTQDGVRGAERLITFDANGVFLSKGIEDAEGYAVSGDRKMIFGGSERQENLNVRDLASGRIISRLAPTVDGISSDTFPDWVSAGAFTSDGSRLAVGDGCSSVHLFNTATGKVLEVFSLYEHQDGTVESASTLTFSPDGKAIAVGTDFGAIKLIDVTTGKLKFSELRHSHLVSSLAFSPDGRILVSGSYDGSIMFWDPIGGSLLMTLVILPAMKTGQMATDWIAFTPDGYYTASPGAARYIRWRVGDKLLPAAAHAREFNRPDLVSRSLPK